MIELALLHFLINYFVVLHLREEIDIMPATRTKKAPALPTLPEGIEPFHNFLIVKIPLNPTSNHSYDIRNITTKTGKKAHTLMSNKAYASFKERAADILAQKDVYKDQDIIDRIIAAYEQEKTMFVPVEMNLVYRLDSVWRSDIDGRVKGTMDAVFKALGINDKLTIDMHVSKRLVQAGEVPHCMVEISTLPADMYLH
jgi:Endodeoxyribonuclease RusA